MIFPGISFTSHGRGSAGILRKAASILTDVSVLYTKPPNCYKIQAVWELSSPSPASSRRQGSKIKPVFGVCGNRKRQKLAKKVLPPPVGGG